MVRWSMKRPTTTIPERTAALEAEWLREKQVTSQFNLGRSPLARLRQSKQIRFASLREPGCKRGTLLYDPASIREYLNGLADGRGEG